MKKVWVLSRLTGGNPRGCNVGIIENNSFSTTDYTVIKNIVEIIYDTKHNVDTIKKTVANINAIVISVRNFFFVIKVVEIGIMAI